MGFKTFGFAGGRADVWEPEEDVYWGGEDEWLAPSGSANSRYSGDRELENPLAAVQMGLIYVNPEGPNGNPDPLASARDIRETFARMAMDDEETVALIAGGHTFGKTHGAGDAARVGAEPEGGRHRRAGPRLDEQLRHRQRRRRDHQRPRGDLDLDADAVEQQLLLEPVRLRVGADQEPGRRAPVDSRRTARAPAPSPTRTTRRKRRAPTMLTTDIALRIDPAYEKISRRFFENPDAFADAFARAWFKLTHRDMGPRARYLGPEVPAEELIWQDPVPAVDHPLVDAADIAALKAKILASGLTVAAAGLDRLGLGLDLPRLGQARRRQRRAHPPRAAEGLGGQPAGAARAGARRRSRASRPAFNAAQAGGKKVSLADLIVLGGGAAIEAGGAAAAGHDGRGALRARPHRRDRGADRRRTRSRVLEPVADGFRNYLGGGLGDPGRAAAGRPGAAADADRAGDDGARRRPARARRQRRRLAARRLHRPAGDADHRLLRRTCSTWARSWKPIDEAEAPVRGPRPGDRRAALDRHPRRPGLRLATRSCARSPRSTPAADAAGEVRRATSSRPGPR